MDFDPKRPGPPRPGPSPSTDPSASRRSSPENPSKSAPTTTSATRTAAGDHGENALVTLPAVIPPKGGGAIQSIGEKFSANVATGTAGLSVPLAASPGRGGTGPNLSVSYDSGGGNGPFGVGWHLSTAAITRKTDKGIPRYIDENDSDVFILSGVEDLVPMREGERILERTSGDFRVRRYRPRVEGGFARIERWVHQATREAHWRVTNGANVTNVYGRTENARIADPARPENVFSWFLEETCDDRGNVTRFEYKREDGAGVDPTRASEANRFGWADQGKRRFLAGAQRYLKRVLYGNDRPDVAADWHFELVFDYGEHATDRPEEVRPWSVRRDPFSSHRPSFDLRTYRLCRRALMFHRFDELGPLPVLVRATEFRYEERDHLTLLRSVVQVGCNGDERAEFPPLDLSYTLRALHEDARALSPGALEGMPAGTGGAARWVDLNGEGIPGALIAEGRGWFYKENLGNGDLAPPAPLRELPSPGDLDGGTQTLVDLGSEGHLDLAHFGPTLPGYFGRTPEGGWAAFTPFRELPRIDWKDPNLRFLDIDGDGLTDVLVTEDHALVWYRSRGKEGFGAPEMITKPRDEERGAAVLFADRSETIFVADMTGDGLSDIVRIRRGEVCYWPNLGYGRFGRKVTMDGSPGFTHDDLFDPRRVRLADIDGSGTTDVLYLGSAGVSVFFNESGNRLTPAGTLALPIPDSAGSIDVIDLLGNGTACVVWSSPLPSDATRPVTYVDLMGGVKPHLLAAFTNGIGGETRIEYAASTKFYLEDKREGRPWATRLAFPVHVVSRVERVDHIAESRLVTRYRYHHGYYDGFEREYRGFAFVETWDAESFGGGAGKGLFPEFVERTSDDLRVPPVHTKTWFHTGAWLEGEALERVLAREFYRGDGHASSLPPTRVPPGLEGGNAREATRALHGAQLRQEIYSEDGTPESIHPYAVSERTYDVRMLEPVFREKHGVFFPHPREELTLAYERNPYDPRISHALALEVDAFGNVLESASIAYPRRRAAEPEQAKLWVTSSRTRVVNHAPVEGWYRLGLPVERTSSELTGLSSKGLFTVEEVRRAIGGAIEIPFEEEAHGPGVERRPLRRKRHTYYRDDLAGPLPSGEVGSRALPYETRYAAFTPGLLREAFEDRLEPDLLDREGGYAFEDGYWWARSGRLVYEPRAFFQSVEAIDPFGNRSFQRFDAASLLVVESRDAAENVTHAEYDYRVLAARLLTDPNENRIAVSFDARGVPHRVALMGKDGAHEGDTLEDPTVRFEYDVLAWAKRREPTFAHTFAREEHGSANRRWQETYVYVDGSGRTAMQKVQAAPGLAPEASPSGGISYRPVEHRWIGSGRTVFDNKGNPVKQYEPFFAATPGYETEHAIAQWGVTPILRYDPLGRLVRTELPNGTFSKIVFDAWRSEAWDPNDTVLESQWYRRRGSPSPSTYVPHDEPARRAAALAARSANTPTRTHVDALGRTFLLQEDNADPGGLFETRSKLDVFGNPVEVTDPRGVKIVGGQRFDMLGRLVRAFTADAGERLTIDDTAGTNLRTWDARGYVFRSRYDRLRRPTHAYARLGTERERLVRRMVYGEELRDAASRNLRGQLYELFDGAGVARSVRFDFKGNLLRAERHLTTTITEIVDWGSIEHASGVEAFELAAPLLEERTYATLMSFDALNRVVSQVTPDGSDMRPRYNPSNLVQGIAVAVRGAHEAKWFAKNIDYNARGQRVSIERADGVVSRFSYDPETFRLDHVETTRKKGHRLQDLRYEYDPVGNVASIVDGVSFGNAAISASGFYEYDALYRLTKAEGREHPGQQPSAEDAEDLPLPHSNDLRGLARYREEYRYDRAGNILEMAHRPLRGDGRHGGWTREYEYASDSNRLLSTANRGAEPHERTERYHYDANGNFASMPHLAEMRWDFANQLSLVDRRGGGNAFFAYSANGDRVRKVYAHSGLLEERIYLGTFELYRKRFLNSDEVVLARETLRVQDGSGTVALLETKTHDADDPRDLGVTRSRYQLSNQLGSSTLEVNDAGLVISYEEYLPYGASALRASSRSAEVSAKRYRYIGCERDEETGLYACGARYYAAWLGRWTAADPAGFIDGLNLYAYARANPLTLSDPGGTDASAPSSSSDDITIVQPGHYTGQESQDDIRQQYGDLGIFYKGDAHWDEAHHTWLVDRSQLIDPQGDGAANPASPPSSDSNPAPVPSPAPAPPAPDSSNAGEHAATAGEAAKAFGVGLLKGAAMGAALLALGSVGTVIGVGLLAYGAYKLVTGGYRDVAATATRLATGQGTATDFEAVGGIVGGFAIGGASGLARGSASTAENAIAGVESAETASVDAAATADAAGSAAAEGTTTLYRAVSQAELADIGATGGFRGGAGSMGNKWFAESAQDAAAWGKKFFGFDKEPIFTVRVQIPNSVANQMMRVPLLDGIGPARSAEGAVIDLINSQGSIDALGANAVP